MTHDLVAAITAWWLAYLFRFNFDIPTRSHDCYATNHVMGDPDSGNNIPHVYSLYRGIWRYASLPDLRRILLAVLGGTAVLSLVLFLLQIPVQRAALNPDTGSNLCCYL